MEAWLVEQRMAAERRYSRLGCQRSRYGAGRRFITAATPTLRKSVRRRSSHR